MLYKHVSSNFSYLTMLPELTSIVQVHLRLLSYGKGYPGERIRPVDSPLKLPPHSAACTHTEMRPKYIKISICKLEKQEMQTHANVHVMKPNTAKMLSESKLTETQNLQCGLMSNSLSPAENEHFSFPHKR